MQRLQPCLLCVRIGVPGSIWKDMLRLGDDNRYHTWIHFVTHQEANPPTDAASDSSSNPGSDKATYFVPHEVPNTGTDARPYASTDPGSDQATHCSTD